MNGISSVRFGNAAVPVAGAASTVQTAPIASAATQPQVDSFERTQPQVKPEVPTGKKVGVGLASFFVPGLGQGINGQWGKAAGFFFGGPLVGTAAFLLGGPVLTIAAGLGMTAWTVCDAVQNAK